MVGTTSSSSNVKASSSPAVTGKSVNSLDDKDDHELLQGAFKGLSNGKAYVSVKDILDWDFVYTLIAEVSCIMVSMDIYYDYRTFSMRSDKKCMDG